MKIRLIKEILPEGRTRYSTEKMVGETWHYVTGSVTADEAEAIRFYETFVAHKGESTTEIMRVSE